MPIVGPNRFLMTKAEPAECPETPAGIVRYGRPHSDREEAPDSPAERVGHAAGGVSQIIQTFLTTRTF
ncbi:hypothetical protein BALCAV_0202045 [Alkalihalobacillus alcalophilus ATCC 27647 = CGMCC 1.3604]|uniref:Uncharacterized protein n=1 Tax=Alkalihalobacillus alcalophilus ATCC 27647 = CGMCC 1.3604 TaxID=1218173 RepID=A0A094WPY5_ALKAL|nr:hypothetical protein BALCAV_0202045 [Alkalihalobacillus alcalophilus ATCC 27647 = CGMCC 1.3604]